MLKKFILFITVFLSLSLSLPIAAEELDKIVAVVNDSVITHSELEEQTKLIINQLQQKKVALPPKNQLKKQVLTHTIDINLQMQLAERTGITVDNSELTQAINTIAKQNHMTIAQLKHSLTESGLSYQQYRDNVKKEITIAKLQQQAISKEVVITDEQVTHFLKQNQNNEKIQYHLKDIVVALSDTPSPEEVTKAQKTADKLVKKLKQGADFSQTALANSSDSFALDGGDLGFRTIAELPDLFSGTVSSMSPGEIKGPMRAANGFHIIKLVETKNDTPKHFVTLTNVEHILIKHTPSMPQQAEKKLKVVQTSLKKGQDFHQLAKRYSDDKVSGKKGGNLGWVQRGQLVAEFERAMNQLKPGQVSQPIKTTYGWHIMRVIKRKKLDDSQHYQKELVRQKLYQARFNEAVQNWLAQMKAGSFIQVKNA